MGSFTLYGRNADAALRRMLANGQRIGLFRDPPVEGTVSSGTSYRLALSRAEPIAGALDIIAQEIGAAAANLTEYELRNESNASLSTDYWYRPNRGNRKKYRASFDIEPIYGTRPGVRVANTARTAAYVEFGNAAAGRFIEAEPGKWLLLPLKQGIGRDLWAKGKPSRRRNTRHEIRRVPHPTRTVKAPDGTAHPLLMSVMKRGQNYYLLRKKVRTFEGYQILARATALGVQNARAVVGMK